MLSQVWIPRKATDAIALGQEQVEGRQLLPNCGLGLKGVATEEAYLSCSSGIFSIHPYPALASCKQRGRNVSLLHDADTGLGCMPEESQLQEERYTFSLAIPCCSRGDKSGPVLI